MVPSFLLLPGSNVQILTNTYLMKFSSACASSPSCDWAGAAATYTPPPLPPPKTSTSRLPLLVGAAGAESAKKFCDVGAALAGDSIRPRRSADPVLGGAAVAAAGVIRATMGNGLGWEAADCD